MIKRYNYHTHCHYCDGVAPLQDYVLAAIENNFESLGFSCHSPLSDTNGFSIKKGDIERYVQEVKALKTAFENKIEILLSFEFEYVPNLSYDFEKTAKQYQMDYILGSVHLINPGKASSEKDLWFTDGGKIEIYDKGIQRFFDGDIQKAVTAFYHQTNQMLENEHIDIIGHFDKVKMNNKNRFFQEEDVWYQQLIAETIDLIKQKDVIVEVNSRGLYKQRSNDFFPGVNILKKLKNLAVPVTVSTDAHAPDDLIKYWDITESALLDLGFKRAEKYKGIHVWR